VSASACPDCRDELAHCHAAWLNHVDGHEECLAVSCRLGPDAHLVILRCREVDAACCG
jgi:hypothetical protein